MPCRNPECLNNILPPHRQPTTFSKTACEKADWAVSNPQAVPGGWVFTHQYKQSRFGRYRCGIKAIPFQRRPDAWNRGSPGFIHANKDGGFAAFEKMLTIRLFEICRSNLPLRQQSIRQRQT
ncbi:hypothetical protein PO124_03530 [Bacillus licheniformis]|nr:hypothetical protein [Bacillus licheniformis]